VIAFGGVAARAAAPSGIPRAKFPIPAQAMNRIGGPPRVERDGLAPNVPATNRCGIFGMRQMPRESRHGGKLPTHDNGEKDDPT
jgi:hypothetical protein